MIITCALLPLTSLPPSTVASSADSAPLSPAKPTEAITSVKISEEIKSLEQQIKSLNDLKTKQYDYLTDEDQKRLSDCQSKLQALQTVHKLAEFAEQLDTAKNANSNILNNLCSGLEKFLGFNSASKGYTGTGIVYSDLDRLCDGVMAFLYQVLKDVSEKQPYSVGKEKLKNLVSDLINKHLCSGHEGFKRLFDKLPAGIEKYNREVRESNKKVSDPINELIKYVKDRGELLASINKFQVTDNIEQDVLDAAEKTMAEKLKECQKKAETFNSVFNLSTQTDMKNAISYLNSTFSERVHVALRAVSHETERLKNLSGKERKDLDGLQEKIKSALRALGNCVNGKIQKDIENLVKQLKEGVKTILGHLKDIDGQLREYVQKLEEWMESAKKEIDRIRNEDVKKILNETIDGITGKKLYIEGDAKALDKKKMDLDVYIHGAKRLLQDKVTDALKEVGTLDSAVRGDLETLKGALQLQLRTYVKDKLLGDIKGSVNEIINGKRNNALDHVVKKVKAYAQKFGNVDEFKHDILKRWMGSILAVEPVKGRLESYVSGNTGRFKQPHTSIASGDDKAFREAIIQHILTKLEGLMVDTFAYMSHVKDDGAASIASHVQAAKGACEYFATQLGAKLKSIGSVDTFASTIANHVEEKLTGSSAAYVPLFHAIRSTLHQLVGVAKRTGQALESFIAEDHVNELDIDIIYTALKVAEGLETDLNKATNTDLVASLPPGSPYKVDEQVNTILDAEIGKSDPGDGKVNLEGVPKFSNYRRSITLDAKSKSDPTGAKEEGKLPEAIGAIKDEASSITVGHITTGLNMISKDIGQHLEELTQAITTTTKNVQSKLEDFKNKQIGNVTHSMRAKENTLQELHCKFVALQKDFETKALKTAEAFAAYADRAGDNIINPLKQHVNNEVKKAQDSIIAEAKKNYISSIQSLLQRFASKVHSELEALPKSIEDDLTLGFKGFMVKFEQRFVNTVKHIKNISSKSAVQTTEKGRKFYPFSQAVLKLRTAFSLLMSHLESQENFTSDFEQIKMPNSALVNLLNKLATSQHYDHTFSDNIDELTKAIGGFEPATYGEANSPLLLNALKNGFSSLHDELSKAYVSCYSGMTIEWLTQADTTGKQNPTEDALNCAKIFLTLLQPLFDGLHELRQNCARNATWEHKTISLTEAAQHGNTITNPLGRFFKRCGYTVCSGPNKHNGELRNTAECRGGHIHKKLQEGIRGKDGQTYKLVTEYDEKEDKDSTQNHGLLKKLFDHLHHYYAVRHLPHFAARKYPCSVFDMLKWLCGLTSSTVYDDLTLNGFEQLFEKPKEEESEATTGDIPIIDEKPACLPAYPHDINTRQLRDVLTEVCHYSQDVLTCLLGNGHSEGVYACDFNTNSDGFMYPGNMDTLLCMLREIVNRVYLQLHFLFQQCQYGTSLSGWLECEYGKDVGGSSWQCNTNQCADQKKNQNCKLHPKCGVKSPLQSFLEDGLQGFLPHEIKYEKSKLECNVKAHSGVQCITPMGFADISHVASLTQTGHRIADVLAGFCGNQMSPLAKMCSLLNCAILSAPKTLGEMFGFYYTLLNGWDRDDKNRKEHRENAYRNAVQDANFGDPSTKLDIFPLFKSTAHTGTLTTHVKGDLFMLVKCDGKTAALDPVGTCGSYLQPLCGDICNMYSKEHADKYLSCIVYLTETFYDLLSKLLEDCKSKCGSPKSRCQQQTCVKNCRAVVSSTKSPSLHHDAACRSIVQCQSSLPNLFKYGFYYGSASDLSGSYNNATKRSCKDFCKALERVLNKEENRGHVLADLVFKKLPDFLFTIRQPFIWLNVALWSLSLFYLICVMAGRMDVLHIRSHLRIPSSHKITAQSLLAAAQVGRLAKISYLQP